MMKPLHILFTAICLYLLSSCNSTSNLKDIPFQSKLDETIRLNYNSKVAILSENMTIEFRKIRESRCPTGVNCFQAGEANISLLITKANQSENLVLTAKGLCNDDDGSCGEQKRVLDYSFKLLNVYPFSEAVKAEDAQYYAKILVSKKGSGGNTR